MLQGDCSDDNCCEEGNYNTGVVVARQSGDVYVANECPAGRVLHFDGGGSLMGGGAIRVGTFPASISVGDVMMSCHLRLAKTTGRLHCRFPPVPDMQPVLESPQLHCTVLAKLPFQGAMSEMQPGLKH